MLLKGFVDHEKHPPEFVLVCHYGDIKSIIRWETLERYDEPSELSIDTNRRKNKHWRTLEKKDTSNLRKEFENKKETEFFIVREK